MSGGVEWLPDGVVRGVHADDVLGEGEHALRVLVLRHHGSQVGHGFAVVFRVGDGCEGFGPAVVLRDRHDVRPVGRFGVFAHVEWKR